MYYEINVAKKDDKKTYGNYNEISYKHYFATAKRSLTSRDETIKILKEFMVKFPEPEYKISINYHPENSFMYSPEEFLYDDFIKF